MLGCLLGGLVVLSVRRHLSSATTNSVTFCENSVNLQFKNSINPTAQSLNHSTPIN